MVGSTFINCFLSLCWFQIFCVLFFLLAFPSVLEWVISRAGLIETDMQQDPRQGTGKVSLATAKARGEQFVRSKASGSSKVYQHRWDPDDDDDSDSDW